MRRCWHKGISESNSPEAKAVRAEHPEVPYDFCKRHCRGYFELVEQREECKHYEVKEMVDEEEETAEDSSLLERMRNMEGLEFPV